MNPIAIILASLTLILKVAVDFRQHQGKKTIDHTKEAAIVVVCLLVAAVIDGIGSWKITGLSLLVFLSCFWALMDSIFGLLIARNPLFLGTTSKLDKLQRKYPALMWFKYAMVPISIILYIKL